MKTFIFQFESLLRYRRHRRDLCRQLLADVQAGDRRLEQHRAALARQRIGQLDQIRNLHSPGRVEVDRSASRRYFAGHVLLDIHMADRDREVIAEQLARCRQALLQADREVKALEKLRDKQRDLFLLEESRREGHELEETWLAAHLAEEARR